MCSNSDCLFVSFLSTGLIETRIPGNPFEIGSVIVISVIYQPKYKIKLKACTSIFIQSSVWTVFAALSLLLVTELFSITQTVWTVFLRSHTTGDLSNDK
jgi:hypothetical protein